MDFSRRTKPKRLAVLQTCGWDATSEGARKAFEGARQQLARAGVELRTRGDDPAIEAVEGELTDSLVQTRRINEWEGRWPLNTYADIDANKLSGLSQERLRNAVKMTQSDYAALIARRDAARAAFEKAAANYDGFVTLAATGAAPLGFATTGNPAMNVAGSFLGCPAITLPVLSDEDLPLGLQLMAGKDRDAALFEVAVWALTALGRDDLIGSAA